MTVVIKAYETPTATFSDDPHVNLRLKRLEISILTMVHDRMARIVALDLTVDAGANILIDAANVLSIALSTLGGRAADKQNLVLAGVVIATIPPVAVFIAAQRYFVESVASSSVKG